MSILRMIFAGEIKKVRRANVGEKDVLEFSICKKNYAKGDAEPSFTWINCIIWEPKEFVAVGIFEGQFIAGSGDVEMTSYVDKDGEKKSKLQVRCNGFDIAFGRVENEAGTIAPLPYPVPAKGPRTRQPVPHVAEDEPPF